MGIAEIVNNYARQHSPYMSGLVNHLPMGQLALYMMGNDLDKVQSYSENYVNKSKIDTIKEIYSKVETIEDCLGKRELYEACLDIITREMEYEGLDNLIGKILNSYPLGISSGLFHTTIRLAYGVEGVALDKDLDEEVARALAYYVTGYRAGDKFNRKVSSKEFIKEFKTLAEDSNVIDLLSSSPTMGQKMKALYNNEKYLNMGPLIEGSPEDKVLALLDLLLPILDERNNIVVLHCITGLHALLVLRKYYNDFNEMVDIITTCIITHLLTVEGVGIEGEKEELKGRENIHWDDIIEKASKSPDVHTIKFIYSANQLYKLYEIPALKQSALNRSLRN